VEDRMKKDIEERITALESEMPDNNLERFKDMENKMSSITSKVERNIIDTTENKKGIKNLYKTIIGMVIGMIAVPIFAIYYTNDKLYEQVRESNKNLIESVKKADSLRIISNRRNSDDNQKKKP
jgi:hypothetical protein